MRKLAKRYGFICVLPHSCVKVLIHSTSEGGLVWREGFYREVKLRWALSQYDYVILGTYGEIWIQRKTHRKNTMEHEGRG